MFFFLEYDILYDCVHTFSLYEGYSGELNVVLKLYV